MPSNSTSLKQQSDTEEKWDGKSHGYPIGYQILFFFLKNLGLRFTYGFLHFIAGYFVLFVPSARNTQYKRFREIHGLTKWKAVAATYRTVHNFAISLVDRAALIGGVKEDFGLVSYGREHIDSMIKGGKGGYLMSCHVGNWEIAGHLLDLKAGKVNVLMYDEEHQKIKQSMPEVQQNRGFNIIPIKNDLGHVFGVQAALGRGELVALHADRYKEGGRVFKRDFCGKPAKFPEGPFMLAAKIAAPRVFVQAIKTGTFTYTYKSSEQIEGKVTPEELMNKYVDWMEQLLMEYPEQWYNFYDFWAE
ncbi:MAG: putative LPLAT superfamily acyltransferase [Flavobacteriales bacterium]|jgi:predicted LPLAT superfamily acyltransferase